MIPRFFSVLVGHHFEGDGVTNGCLSTIPAGFGRLRWTTDAVARGKTASSTVWRVVRRIINTVDVEHVCMCDLLLGNERWPGVNTRLGNSNNDRVSMYCEKKPVQPAAVLVMLMKK